VLFTLLLIVASGLPALLGLSSRTFLPLELLAGMVFLAVAVRFYRRRQVVDARRLFFASIIYLPILLGLLVATKS
jgi:protoheme IX farnesyltransferase